MNVICFGDSNTYGYDPRSYLGGRYDADCRWPDLLAGMTGWNIKNAGMNGRTIPSGAISVPSDTQLLMVMLGTNDLLQGTSVFDATKRMANFLSGVASKNMRIILIAPPPMKKGAWTEKHLLEASCCMIDAYRELAEQMSIYFADTKDWNIDLTYDGVHFSEDGHKSFAKRLYQLLKSKTEFKL